MYKSSDLCFNSLIYETLRPCIHFGTCYDYVKPQNNFYVSFRTQVAFYVFSPHMVQSFVSKWKVNVCQNYAQYQAVSYLRKTGRCVLQQQLAVSALLLLIGHESKSATYLLGQLHMIDVATPDAHIKELELRELRELAQGYRASKLRRRAYNKASHCNPCSYYNTPHPCGFGQ